MTSEKRSKSVERHKGVRAQPVSIAPPTADGGAAQRPDKAAWHEHASFQVTFYSSSDADGRSAWQTRAYHDETGGEAMWPEVTGEQLVRWMSEQAALPPAAETARMPTIEVSATAAETAAPEPAVDLQLILGEWSLDEVLAEQQVGHPQVARHLRASI